MHTKLVSILSCPNCSCDLYLQSTNTIGEVVVEGNLICTNCQRLFPIRAQIPYFLESEQYKEIEIRNKIANRFRGADFVKIKQEIAKHHYMALMEKEADNFTQGFKNKDWLLDAGIGWGWHWQNIESPNIIGIDFSFSSLLISKQILNGKIDRNVHLICADITRLPLKKKVIDGIWSVQTLQHIIPKELPNAIDNLKRILKREGSFQIYWLNFSHLFKVCYRLFKKEYKKEIFLENHFLKRMTAIEIMSLFDNLAEQKKPKVCYNESIFHPDLRLIHNSSYLLFLENILSSIPLLNSFISRQIVIYANDGCCRKIR